MALALFIYETASTAFFIPYAALGMELTPNFHERTRLYGYVHVIAMVGFLIGIANLWLLSSAEDKRMMAFYIAVLGAGLVTGLILWSTWRLPERADYQGRGADNPYKAYADVLRNPHARLVILVYAIETFGAASVAMLVPFLVEYVIPMDKMPIDPNYYMVSILLVYGIPMVVFTPLWIRLSRIVGKKNLWAFSMWLSGFVFVGFYFAMNSPVLIWVLAFGLGLGWASRRSGERDPLKFVYPRKSERPICSTAQKVYVRHREFPYRNL